VQEAVVSSSTGKFTTASDAQGLIDGLFKPVVGLFYIPILMSHPSIVPGRLHAVVGHERIVPLSPVFMSRLVQVTHRCAEMIGAVLLGYSAQLPQCFFDALGQSLEGFAEADADRFRIGVRQYKVIHQVRERRACNGDAQISHVGEIRLRSLTWDVSLFKDHLLFGSMQRSPPGDVTLQRADLYGLIAPRMTFTEQGKERFALQRWITFQLRDHPGPILLKWVDAGLPVVRSFEMTGQLSDLLILASRAFAHASTSGSHSLGSTFASFLHRELDLGIFLHMTPFHVLCDRCHERLIDWTRVQLDDLLAILWGSLLPVGVSRPPV
jgi:hypothetical protein